MPRTRQSKALEPAAAATSMYCHIQALPVELLEWIAQYQDSKDFFNLRLTSKDISSKLINHMARTYFQEVHFLLMEYISMKTLQSICEHPVFGKSLKTIKLNTATFADEEKHEHKYSLRKISTALNLATQKRRCWYSLQISHREIALDRLKLVLLKLLRNGNAPAIETVAGGLNPVDGPWHFEFMEKEFGKHTLTYDSLRVQEHFTLIVQALYETEYPIQDLRLGSYYNARLDPWTIQQVAHVTKLPTPFRFLRSLHLFLEECVYRPYRAEYMGEESERTNLECQRLSLLKIVSEAKFLEVLHLDVQNFYSVNSRYKANGTLFKTLTEDIFRDHEEPLQYIRDLKLTGQNIPRQTLVDFVHGHRDTLQKLELWEISEVLHDESGEASGLAYVDLDAFKRQLFVIHAAEHPYHQLQLNIGRVYEGSQQAIYRGDAGWKLPVWETSEDLKTEIT